MGRKPAERPAPGSLELVRAFVNTLDLDDGTDALNEPHAATAWLVDAGLLPPDVCLDTGDLARITSVREAFRAVLVANAAGTPADEAVATLNGVATAARIALRMLGPNVAGPVLPGRGVTGAMGRLVAIAMEAIISGRWTRLKACPADGCHWAFYDVSRNRSSRWCDMGLCGNRAKRLTLQRRRRLHPERPEE